MRAVAVPYIIAIVLGIIVIAIVGYLLFMSSNNSICAGKDAECRGRILEWCTTKTESAKQKINEICSSCIKGFDFKANVCIFCKTVIPGWNDQANCGK
ncbi:MAG: hypothetical protein HYW23_03860 [Candidatus Aenigmarchaeota archaeon]|nr:hypothetical protein [Candidatus Aenigmarchaeota archaeon]